MCPVLYDDTLFQTVEGCLNWLNEKPLKEKAQAVRIGLTRTYFEPSKTKNGKWALARDEML